MINVECIALSGPLEGQIRTLSRPADPLTVGDVLELENHLYTIAEVGIVSPRHFRCMVSYTPPEPAGGTGFDPQGPGRENGDTTKEGADPEAHPQPTANVDPHHVTPSLLVLAGEESQRRGWTSVEVGSAEQLLDCSPSGDPLVILSPAGDLDAAQARAISAMHGAGRAVLVVSHASPPFDVVDWLPKNAWVVGDAWASTRDRVIEAGLRAAAQRGWNDVAVVDAEDLLGATPIGGALLVPATASEISLDTVRTVASLKGAGRRVLVVVDGPLPDELLAWAPQDSILIASGAASATPASAVTERLTTAPKPVEPPEAQRSRLLDQAPAWIREQALDPEKEARIQSATRSSTAELLWILPLHPDPDVRQAAHGNRHTPAEALRLPKGRS